MQTSPSELTTDDCQQILKRNLDYQRALRRILHKIRNSIKLRKIFTSTNQDIAQLLSAERVTLYRFNEDWSGHFVNDH